MKGASLIAPFGLRMPEGLKEKISERAKLNGRSMNAEIVHILEQHFDTTDAEKIAPYLTSKHLSHFSGDGNVIDIKTANDIVRYIELRTEEYKKEMLDGLMAIAKSDANSSSED